MDVNANITTVMWDADKGAAIPTADQASVGSITGGGSWATGTAKTLAATPNANSGWSFVGWEIAGGGPGTLANATNPATATYTPSEGSAPYNGNGTSGAATLRAKFERNHYTISTAVSPFSPAGGTATAGGSWQYGAGHTLTATAKPGYTFDRWVVTTGPGILSTPNEETTDFTVGAGNATVTAYFTKGQYTITTEMWDADKNIKLASPGSVSSGGTWDVDSGHTLKATAGTGWVFDGWEIASGGTGSFSSTSAAETTYTVGSNATTVRANFNSIYGRW